MTVAVSLDAWAPWLQVRLCLQGFPQQGLFRDVGWGEVLIKRSSLVARENDRVKALRASKWKDGP